MSRDAETGSISSSNYYDANDKKSNTYHDNSESNGGSNSNSFMDDLSLRSGLSGGIKAVTHGAKSSIKKADQLAKSAVVGGFKQGANLVGAAVTLVSGSEDGAPHNAGFLSFRTLSTTNAARQMVHNGTPFSMKVVPAPDPDDVFWMNVGRSHQDLQVGRLLSMGATTLMCFFWTIPMAFFSSLSSVEGLKEQFGWIEDAIEFMPILEPILQQLAPFLVIAFNSLCVLACIYSFVLFPHGFWCSCIACVFLFQIAVHFASAFHA